MKEVLIIIAAILGIISLYFVLKKLKKQEPIEVQLLKETEEEKEKMINLLNNLLKDLSQCQLPREVCKLVKNGDLFFKDDLANQLLQKIVRGEITRITRINSQALPNDAILIYAMPFTIIRPLQALKEKVIITAHEHPKNREKTEKDLKVVQGLVAEHHWKGFYNDIKEISDDGACVSDVWAENKDGWIVLSKGNSHWHIPDWFNWSIFKEVERRFDF